MGPISWAEKFLELLEERGVNRGQGARNDQTTSANVAQVAAELGVKRRTAFNRLALAEELKSYPDLAEKVDCKEMEAQRARRIIRERKADKRRKEPMEAKTIQGKIDIRLGDFRDVLADIPDGRLEPTSSLAGLMAKLSQPVSK